MFKWCWTIFSLGAPVWWHDRIRFRCDFLYTGDILFNSEMATFKFRATELWIYMQIKFILYSRSLEHGLTYLNLNHILFMYWKGSVNNWGIKSTRVFLVNKRLKKSHLHFTGPRGLKHSSMPSHWYYVVLSSSEY